LEDLGLQYDYVTEKRIINGILDSENFKVLWLPHTHALNPATADVIKAFTDRGGAVIADTMPGRFDHHLAPRPSPDLAELFNGESGRLFERELARYERRYDEETDGRDESWGSQFRDALKTLLTDVGIECPVRIEGSDGPLPPRIEMVRWTRRGIELIGVFHYPAVFRDRQEWPPPAQIRLSWEKPRAVHVLQEESSPGADRVTGIELVVPVGRARFAVLSPDRLDPVQLAVNRSVKQGNIVSARIKTGRKSVRPLLLQGWMPDGTEAMWMRKSLVLEDGNTLVELPLAYNEEPGTWKLTATDWFAGSIAEATFEVGSM
jgi:hypothetical protein